MRKFLLCVATLSLALPLFAAPDDASLPVLKTKVKSLAAFKNGLGFVYRTGNTPLKDGWALMDAIPPACLGTLWFGTPTKGTSVSEVISFKGKSEKEVDAVSLPELLAANVGKRATVTFNAGMNQVPGQVTGTILSVPTDRKPDDPSASTNRYSGYSDGYSDSRGQIVIIKTVQGTVTALNKSTIQTVQFEDGAVYTTKITKDVNQAKIRLAGNPSSAEIDMMYLEKGIAWTPSYLVNIENDKEASITLEAVLSNDVEDLEDADVSFVVGYPNFLYADSITPLALQQTVASFLQSLTGSTSQNYTTGSLLNQSTGYYGYNTARDNSYSSQSNVYSAAKPMAGESNEDLYIYKQSHVTMKKGDRARYSVFTGKVPYEHIYQWNVPDTMAQTDQSYSYSRPDTKPTVDLSDQVWHSLRLTNTTKQPWTTAPALTMNGTMPVAQDTINYTPAGAKTTLKLTVATDVKTDQLQTEVSRTQLKNTSGYSYDEVTVKGKLTVKNWKKNQIKINVNKSLTGEVLEADQDGKITKTVKNISAVNPSSQIEWEFALNPGETKELNYQYKTLVRR